VIAAAAAATAVAGLLQVQNVVNILNLQPGDQEQVHQGPSARRARRSC